MVLGLRCCSPARRPHSASLSVRVPTLAHLLAASFSLALTGSALQFSYRYHHRSGRGPFIPIVLAHAGHTSAGIPAGDGHYPRKQNELVILSKHAGKDAGAPRTGRLNGEPTPSDHLKSRRRVCGLFRFPEKSPERRRKSPAFSLGDILTD